MDVDLWEVIEGASTKPFGFQAFYPGHRPRRPLHPRRPLLPRRGGPASSTSPTKFIELAADTNLRMADYVRTRVGALLNDHGKALSGARVLCYGASFKPKVSDMRNSRAVRVIELLAETGAEVRYHDPRVDSIELGHEGRLAAEHAGAC